MSTIIIISPKDPRAGSGGRSSVQTFDANHVDGARTSDLLRAVAEQLDFDEAVAAPCEKSEN